jgi:hypothetical protein
MLTDPWNNEPDKKEFKYAGFKCLIVRHPTFKHLCGYVGVPEGHPFYGRDYDFYDTYFNVHGGITYSGMGNGKDGFTKGLYWIGFNCNHYQDYSPGLSNFYEPLERRRRYKTISYVEKEVKKLAEQMSEKHSKEMLVSIAVNKLSDPTNKYDIM